MFVEIAKIPICMMASLDKSKLNGIIQDKVRFNMNGFCSDRCFERLPGYIDINVLSADNCQSLISTETKLAIPVCLLSNPDEMLIVLY